MYVRMYVYMYVCMSEKLSMKMFIGPRNQTGDSICITRIREYTHTSCVRCPRMVKEGGDVCVFPGTRAEKKKYVQE